MESRCLASFLAAAILATSLLALTKVFHHPSPLPLSRRLPSAIIIGVKKGGTRALLEFLRLHPAVEAPGPEIHFFDRFYERGLDWYRSQMPAVSSDQVVVEKTPAYFVKREVPARVAAMSPETKLVLVLRDPVTRALSDYAQSFSKGRTLKSFHEMAFLDFPNNTVINQRWNGVRLGLYERHLRKWLPHFPLSRLHLVDGERLITSPVDEIRRLEEFLGLTRYVNEDQFSYNSSKGFPCVRRHPGDSDYRCLGKTKGRTHPILPAKTESSLRAFFAPHSAKLVELLEPGVFKGGRFRWLLEGAMKGGSLR